MQLALSEARNAATVGEVPIGAVVYTADGTVLAKAHNQPQAMADATAHAELLAARGALAMRMPATPYLDDCYIAVTLEPCAMCAQALSWLRVKAIYFGAYDVKSGGVENGAQVLKHAHHKPEVIGGLCEVECAELMKDFFAKRR
ncbi:MAG: nucleoside deaminase [Pseudomonadaceae bacterium]|nr:nucleoside deaminase [Pseudomonadaceae bacterium]